MELCDSVGTLKGIGPKKQEILENAGICTLEDLLYLFPRKYEDRRNLTALKDVKPGSDYLVRGVVIQKRVSGNPYNRKAPLNVLFTDETGVMGAVFFGGRFLAGAFKEGESYTFYGRVSSNMDRLQMIHPEFHKEGADDDVRGIVPIYPQIQGISQNEIRKLQITAAPLAAEIEEWLPEKLVRENRLASPAFAIENIHFPKDGKAVLAGKFRLIFDELITLETGLFYMRNDQRKDTGGITIDTSMDREFLGILPFKLTEGQQSAWQDMKSDLETDKVMNRLIQGDVGSGKTAMAELAMYCAARNGYQSVMMAPTELLARQHYLTLSNDFSKLGISVGLLCSSMKQAEKKSVLDDLKSGKIQILTGTHAVIQPEVEYSDLGLVITDEQHRFGVRQRSLLSKKGNNPNILVMTATPIPRTLAVIIYGDLDISQIRTMPAGRKPVKTVKVLPEERKKMYDFVRRQLSEHRQAYVVAPLIEESDKIDAKSADELYKELKSDFKGYKVAMIHGAMKQDDKDEIMAAFAAGDIDVLVSTVVIEVGINVANATVMVIENCERFGLAQLHQLRGRVGRGSEQSYCFLVSETDSEVAEARCQIMCQTTDGFEIAEQDLELRGPGEIFGTRQHGLPELHISDLVRHADVLEKAKDAAKSVIDTDPALTLPENRELKRRVEKMFGEDVKLEL